MMRAWLGWSVVLFGLLVVCVVVMGVWARNILHRPYSGYDGERVVEVSSGHGASAILDQLAAAGVLPETRITRAYLVHVLDDAPLRAGEYRFVEAMSPVDVLDKLIRGEVMTYPVTLVEGLTADEIADHLAGQGFGDHEILLHEMRRPDRIADLDPEAEDLEGYLYPDTYHFARGTSEAEIVDTLVRTFRRRLEQEIEPRWQDRELSLRQLVTLASIIEKEAAVSDERPLVSSVYHNRLRRGIGLYADPTVIYALKRHGTWDGNLRRRDLRFDSPYNTYVYPGLPPGPICSPGVASLLAAANPADTRYLYFVSRNDGTHVFADTLSEHNRNVERWQRQYWRQRWAREGRGGH